jgi:hypothetical protein
MTDALVGVLCALALRVAGALALAVGITGLITALDHDDCTGHGAVWTVDWSTATSMCTWTADQY